LINEASSTLERREVQAGQLSEFGVLIRSGLQAGDQIVVAGVSTLVEGQEVVILGGEGGSGRS